VSAQTQTIIPLPLLALLVAGCSPHPTPTAGPSEASQPPRGLHPFEFERQKLGAGFRIALYAPDEATAQRAAGAAYARVDELDRILSNYDPESELSRLSRRTDAGAMADPVPVSQDLWNVLVASAKAAEVSGGAFDITIGPFVRLWRRSRDMGQLPSPDRIETERRSVGHQLVKLDAAGRTVQLVAPRMRLDVNGIAVGYIVDEAMKVLRRHGAPRALIDAGGDLAIGDPPPGQAGWRVGVQSLEAPNEIAGYVSLCNANISTAGDTYRFVELDGKRYSHIIDPRTGLGLTRRVGVTVVARDGMTADWLDTAMSVMEPGQALELVERIPGAAARITTVDEQGRASVIESQRYRGLKVTPGQSSTAPAARGR
jgi:FAD:protein FMN transferase